MALFRILVSALVLGILHAQKPGAANMNGEYLTSTSTNLDPAHQTFNTDYASKGHEYFDVYSPVINSTYGMVYWTQMDDVLLPDHIIKRFANKTIAITGYEMDQVFHPSDTSGEVSVPINFAYNHHYVAWIKGVNSEMVLTQAKPHEHSYWMRGDGSKYVSRTKANDPNPTSKVPTSQIFAEGNGGESRKSFHGYPGGVAQLIESPHKFVLNPMQIDTWNRDTSILEPFKAGPLPPQAESPPGADYSGLLECPCTDRLTKNVNLTYSTRTAGTCGSQARIYKADHCFDGIEELLGGAPSSKRVVDDHEKFPSGCALGADGTAVFNKAISSKVTCGHAKTAVANGVAKDALTGVEVNITLDGSKGEARIELTGPSDVWFGVGINANVMADHPYAIIVSGKDVATMDVSERKLGSHTPGTALKSSITVLSNIVNGENVRKVTMTRPLVGVTGDYYSFDLDNDNTVPLIVAIGSSPVFAYHKTHSSASISLFNKGSNTCVCSTGSKGEICGNVVGGCIAFGETGGQDLRGARCPAKPLSDLASQSNPICTIQQYSGGLRCCHHRNVLLQKAQGDPWPDKVLSYKMKFRFWFEEYVPPTPQRKASHENLVRFYWQTESFAGEYDVPKGSLNMPGTTRNPKTGGYEYKITSEWQVKDMVWGCDPRTSADHCTGNGTGIQLRYAGGHCHAPSCVHIELSTNITGEWKLLCRQLPHIGQGNVHEDKFDEKGYIALPPCLWGTKKEGLVAPVTLPFDSWLRSEKINNSTNGHYGEMASWQMRGVVV